MANDEETRDDTTAQSLDDTTTACTQRESKFSFRTRSFTSEYTESSPNDDKSLNTFTSVVPVIQRQEGTKLIDANKRNVSFKDARAIEGTNTPIENTSKNTPLKRQRLEQIASSGIFNDQDALGDGDQSPINDPYVHQVYLELFQSGMYKFVPDIRCSVNPYKYNSTFDH
jgi:hypothetical protein